MAERYRQLLKNDRQYQIDCPVMLAASALLLDTQTQRVLAQLKMQSIVSTSITAVCVVLECFDPAGSSVLCHEEFWFRDLTIQFAEQFGQKTAIPISNEAVCKFTVHIETVVFADGHTWSAAEPRQVMQTLPEKESITTLLGMELAEQYIRECKKLSGQDSVHVPKEHDNLVVCACGAIYDSAEQTCPNCGLALKEYEPLIEKSYLEERLTEYQAAQRIVAEESIEQQRIAAEKEKVNRARTKKRLAIILPSLAVIVISLILLTKVVIPSRQYKKAEEYYSAENYTQAIIWYQKAGAYQDAHKQVENCLSKLGVTLSAGNFFTAIQKDDGTWASNWLYSSNTEIPSDWTNIAAFSEGLSHYVYLKTDGTVIADGDNYWGQCNVSGWQNIVAISAGRAHTVGLTADGTVVATGYNDDGECDVSGWRNIVAISTSSASFFTVGLRADGTVVATGRNSSNQCNVSDWQGVVDISTGCLFTIGLKADGTVVATGDNKRGQCDVSGWRNIVAISAGSYHTIGLKADGTVVATGDNKRGQCDVSGWRNIVAISVDGVYTIGLKADGTVVATGWNDGQCDVSNWKLW